MADINIELEVTKSQPDHSTGWKPSLGTGGYWYRYSGGNANDANNPGGFKITKSNQPNPPKKPSISN